MTESFLWISEATAAEARRAVHDLHDTFEFQSNWDSVGAHSESLLSHRAHLPDAPGSLRRALHQQPEDMKADIWVGELQTSSVALQVNIATYHCFSTFDGLTRWTITVLLDFKQIAEATVSGTAVMPQVFNPSCSSSFELSVQFPPLLPVDFVHHLAVCAANHRSGGTACFAALVVAAPAPSPPSPPGRPALSSAAAATILSSLLLEPPPLPARHSCRSQHGGWRARTWEVSSVSDSLGTYHAALEMASCSLEGLARFRSLRWYTGVLEGVGAWHGAVRLEIIRQQSQHLLASLPCAGAHTSDAIGDPRRVWSPSAGILAAPQTLLYAAVLSDLEQLCGDLSGFRVVEIGGGYGGQLKVATDFFALSQYVMVDLAEALDLQQRFRFLAHCGSEPSPMGGGRGPGRRGCGWRKRPGDLQLRVARVHAAGARLVLGRSAGQGATRLHPQQQPLDGT